MPAQTLYWCLVRETTGSEAFFQTYWTRASQIGSAIGQIVAAARLNGLQNPVPTAIDPCELGDPAGGVEPGPDAQTFWTRVRIYFPPEPCFTAPDGVIAARAQGGNDRSDIHSGFTLAKDARGLTTIEINVDRSMLLPLYERLINVRPSYQVFWYLMHAHWDNSADQFLVNPSLDNPGGILEHLRGHEADSLRNGHVTLTAFCKEGATNLNISDHKRIQVLTYSDSMAAEYVSVLKAAGYPKKRRLVSIDKLVHHWHYQPSESRSRSQLAEHLLSIGFRHWTPGK